MSDFNIFPQDLDITPLDKSRRQERYPDYDRSRRDIIFLDNKILDKDRLDPSDIKFPHFPGLLGVRRLVAVEPVQGTTPEDAETAAAMLNAFSEAEPSPKP